MYTTSTVISLICWYLSCCYLLCWVMY